MGRVRAVWETIDEMDETLAFYTVLIFGSMLASSQKADTLCLLYIDAPCPKSQRRECSTLSTFVLKNGVRPAADATSGTRKARGKVRFESKIGPHNNKVQM